MKKGIGETEASASWGGCSSGGKKETTRGNRSKDDWRRTCDWWMGESHLLLLKNLSLYYLFPLDDFEILTLLLWSLLSEKKNTEGATREISCTATRRRSWLCLRTKRSFSRSKTSVCLWRKKKRPRYWIFSANFNIHNAI